jgi:hypothetical protein
MIKMLIYIEDEDHERLRRISFEQRISMAAIVRKAVGEWLRRQQAKKGGGR